MPEGDLTLNYSDDTTISLSDDSLQIQGDLVNLAAADDLIELTDASVQVQGDLVDPTAADDLLDLTDAISQMDFGNLPSDTIALSDAQRLEWGVHLADDNGNLADAITKAQPDATGRPGSRGIFIGI